MSLATFKRKFTETYKQSPAKYLLAQKLKNAQYLLEHSKIPISDIAHQCGFDDLSSFNKAFKKEAGLSPSDYRLSRKS
jgi:AraC-like DNA-binding protein